MNMLSQSLCPTITQGCDPGHRFHTGILSLFCCSANLEFFAYADDLPQPALT